MMLVIETQYLENYAWSPEGGIGTGADAYWKTKGGSTYRVINGPTNVDMDEVVSILRPDIEYSNDYSQEYIIGYGLKADDYKTVYELEELDYAEPVIEYEEVVGRYA